jgi:hypothetical protein
MADLFIQILIVSRVALFEHIIEENDSFSKSEDSLLPQPVEYHHLYLSSFLF